MTERWWAPDEPGIGVSASDLVLLEPGEDPQYDLGAAIFALHRVGAAACQVVADTPMLSERTLVEYLAMARESYAPPVVESVAKALGEPTYAGLLVRDLADDAERGALDLFRTAVAKGVAPPLAAQRVGLVYGCPADRLGAFKPLACTPGANPVALADAADRALFTYVESVTRQEMADQEIAKAATATAVRTAPTTQTGEDDPSTPWYDARAVTGRFVKQPALSIKDILAAGSDGNRLAQLLGMPAHTPTVAKEPAKAKPQRKTRQTRQTRQTKAPVEVRYEVPAQQRAKVQAKVEQQAKQRAVTDAQVKALMRTPDLKPTPTDDPFAEAMAQLPDNADYGGLRMKADERLSFFLDPMGILMLDSAAKDAGNQFRVGHLIKHAGQPVLSKQYQPETDKINAAASAEIAYLATIENDTDLEEPVSFYVPDDGKIGEAQDFVQEFMSTGGDAAAAVAHKYLANQGVSRDDPDYAASFDEIVEQVVTFRDRTDGGTHFVYAPDQIAVVNEVRIADNSSVRGRSQSDDGYNRSAHLDVELDPNQVYEFTGAHKNVYDGANQVMVVIHDIAVKDDDDPFGKASDYLEVHREKQDERGRFVAVDLNAMISEAQRKIDAAAQESLKRKPRQSRQTRQVRRSAPAQEPAVAEQRAHARADQRTPAEVRQVARLKALAPAPKRPDGQYMVLGGSTFQALLENEAAYGGQFPNRIHLEASAARELFENDDGLDGAQVNDALAEYQGEAAAQAFYDPIEAENHIDFTAENTIYLHRSTTDVDAELVRLARGYFQQHPGITDLDFRLGEDLNSDLVSVEAHGITTLQQPVVIRNEVTDWHRPMTLRIVPPNGKAGEPVLNDSDAVRGNQTSSTVYNIRERSVHFMRGGHDVYVLSNT
jgi:hypothetical protein